MNTTISIDTNSTFTWFSATNAVTVTQANDNAGQNITISEVHADVGSVPVDGLTVTVQEPTWEGKASSKKLELAHVPAASNSANVPNYVAGRVTDGGVAPGLSTAWLGNEASPVVHELGFTNAGAPVMATSDNALYGSVTIKLATKQATDTYGYVHSASDVADDLDGKWLTLTLSNKSGVGDEAIRFFADPETLLAESVNSDNTISVNVHLEADDLKVAAGQTVTLYFFILGDNITDTDLSGEPGSKTANAGTILASTSASRNSENA